MSGSVPLPGGSPVASPIGSPSGSVTSDTSRQVRGESGPTALPTHLPSTSVLSPSGRAQRHGSAASPVRLSGRQRAQLTASLAERDWQVLTRLGEHGFLSSSQVQRFVFTDHGSAATAQRTARRVLSRLARDHLVQALPRRQGGPLGGSSPVVWQLTTAGRRLLDDARPSQRALTPSQHRLLHSLAVADVHLALRDHVRQTGQAEAVVQVEPACWREFSGLGGERRTIKPDLAADLPGHDEQGAYVDRWFIEVDLGTESLPTLLRKCQVYETYRASGSEQADGGTFPLVLWVFTRPDRAAQLAEAADRRNGLTTALYRFASMDSLPAVLAGGAS